ncbi:MAG TPA: hypothetical protein VGU01_03325 [Sphingomicrobium sp.]|nr:hypothetical protein [Sphingomicrobium sp.]
MNVILKTEPARFIENNGIGRALALGNATRFDVALADPRYVMVTVAQDELPKGVDVLKGLVQHNRLQLGDMGAFPVPGYTRSSPRLGPYDGCWARS